MTNIEQSIQSQLFALQDVKYKQFQCKLMPTVNSETVIGVRTPQLRKMAKELSKTQDFEDFLNILPHTYYEENNLHGMLIETVKDYDKAIDLMENFLPFIDNWATCDMISPKIFKKYPQKFYEKIKVWLKSDLTYTVRFGVGMLLGFYLDETFKPEMPKLVSSIHSEEYYINMMIAWYFATALVKQYDTVMPYFQEQRLDKWIHNKAIQKSLESYRVNDETKAYLRTLKIK